MREFYEPREDLNEEYSLVSSEEALRAIAFQRHDHSEGTGQPNSRKAESSWTSGCGGFSLPALLHAHVLLLLGLHGTKLNPDMTTLSPGLGVPEHLFFSSWLFIPEVSAGPVLGAASVPELNCTPVAGFLSTF